MLQAKRDTDTYQATADIHHALDRFRLDDECAALADAILRFAQWEADQLLGPAGGDREDRQRPYLCAPLSNRSPPDPGGTCRLRHGVGSGHDAAAVRRRAQRRGARERASRRCGRRVGLSNNGQPQADRRVRLARQGEADRSAGFTAVLAGRSARRRDTVRPRHGVQDQDPGSDSGRPLGAGHGGRPASPAGRRPPLVPRGRSALSRAIRGDSCVMHGAAAARRPQRPVA